MIANCGPFCLVWVGILIGLLVGLVLVLMGCQCAKRGFHLLRNVAAWFCRLPWPTKIVAVSLTVVCLAIGGVKSPPRLNAPHPTPSAEATNVVALTADQLAAQLALVRVGTNEAWRFNPPTNAVMWEKLLKRGAADDFLEIAAPTGIASSCRCT